MHGTGVTTAVGVGHRGSPSGTHGAVVGLGVRVGKTCGVSVTVGTGCVGVGETTAVAVRVGVGEAVRDGVTVGPG